MNTRDLLVGAGLGAALSYVLDPQAGGRRRALARDAMVRASRKTRDGIDATARDIANRSRGIAATTRGRLSREEVDDWRLIERVRARLGRACSHPHALDVDAVDGEVTLRGPILSSEVDGLLSAVATVRGVRTVINELEPHDSSQGVPSLQGEGNIAGPSLDVLQRNWAPATRALVAAASLAATGVCLTAYARR
jgi:hypothetical protein